MKHHVKLSNSNTKVSHRDGGCKDENVYKAKDRAVVTTRNTQDDTSPGLLQLPIEIRHMIYELVLGGMFLHNSSGHGQRRWSICRAKISEKEAQRRFDQAKAPAWCAEDAVDRHAGCLGYVRHSPLLHLSLLLTCRQVHGEATHILLSTNTFSFSTSALLQNFLGLFKSTESFWPFPGRTHRLAVCSIHLNISFPRTEDAWFWKMVVPKIAQALPNLKNINITLNQGAQLVRYEQDGPWNIARDDAAHWEALMQSLLSLESLPLKSVTFDINDRHIERRWFFGKGMMLPQVFEPYQTAEELYRWPLKKKQSRARAVREAILWSSS